MDAKCSHWNSDFMNKSREKSNTVSFERHLVKVNVEPLLDLNNRQR